MTSNGADPRSESKGQIRDIQNISTYLVYPQDNSTKNAILFLTDGLGHKCEDSQLLADQFASHGYFVVMPDLFGGDTVLMDTPEIFNIDEWKKSHMPENTEPIIDTIIEEMRGILGCERIGGVGYLFGGRYVCRYLKPGKLDAGFMAHPLTVLPHELRGIKGPLSIVEAPLDVYFTSESHLRREREDILYQLEVPYQLTVFSNVGGGFAIRHDRGRRLQRFAKEQAFGQAVRWFDMFLLEH